MTSRGTGRLLIPPAAGARLAARNRSSCMVADIPPGILVTIWIAHPGSLGG